MSQLQLFNGLEGTGVHMSYWYLAHNDELLIDLDEAMRDTGKGPHIELYFRRRLREAILAGCLHVLDVYLTRSASDHHFQAVIRVKGHLAKNQWSCQIERLVWQWYLGGDLYRARADLMRASRRAGVVDPSVSLLILPELIPHFYRAPDAVCACNEKHKRNSKCPAFKKYRGAGMVELFGPLRKGTEKMVPLPLGKIPMDLILKVDK